MKTGIVYLVGAGPGDPDLLTVRAEELLVEADCVVYDNLVNDAILEICPPQCERIYVGKEPGGHAIAQEEIHRILVDQAAKGHRVVRLKGGDPFVFGRGGEELAILREAGVAVEIVPGITAALGAAAMLGLPLTHRDLSSSVSFVTGHENPDKHEFRVDFHQIAGNGGTLCIYMGVGQLERIAGELIAGGLAPETPAAIVQWATLARQRSLAAPLAELPARVSEAGITSPAVVFVGAVAGTIEATPWFEDRPLYGRRIAITRMREQSSRLSRLLTEAGADVIPLPLIRVQPAVDRENAAEVFADLGHYDWLIFTSGNGVKHFFDLFFRAFDDIRSLGFLRIAAVGDATARELRKLNLRADVVPRRSSAESLAEAMADHENLENLQILVVTGNRNRKTLTRRLEDERAIVDTLQVYRTELTPPEESRAMERFVTEGADAILFASSSAVESFHQHGDGLKPTADARQPLFASIGPQTSKSLRDAGLAVDIESPEADLEVFVEALVDHFAETDQG